MTINHLHAMDDGGKEPAQQAPKSRKASPASHPDTDPHLKAAEEDTADGVNSREPEEEQKPRTPSGAYPNPIAGEDLLTKPEKEKAKTPPERHRWQLPWLSQHQYRQAT